MRQETRDRRHETGDMYIYNSIKVMGKKFFKYGLVGQFYECMNYFPLNVVLWRKDLKSGACRGNAN